MNSTRACAVCGITLDSFRKKTCDHICAEARKRKRTRMAQLIENSNPKRHAPAESKMNGHHCGYIDRARRGHGYNSGSEHEGY